MNKVTKLTLAGVVASTLVFGTTGCSSDCGTSGCDAKKLRGLAANAKLLVSVRAKPGNFVEPGRNPPGR
ncbi:MAG: hypothetical protein MK132_23100 [Lentisphaerales bacterium]|nr:hypothetical protein [Lentisphaerales bacterium]